MKMYILHMEQEMTEKGYSYTARRDFALLFPNFNDALKTIDTLITATMIPFEDGSGNTYGKTIFWIEETVPERDGEPLPDPLGVDLCNG